MKQLNNENKIYIIKQIKEKEKIVELSIENYTLDKNNLLGKSNTKININLSSLEGQYLYHKLFPDTSLILLSNSSLKLYQNFIKDNKNFLTSKISFYYEKHYKINSFQINENKYLITNGKSIILVEKNKKLLKIKAYNRLNNISVISVIKAEEEKDKFSGYIIKIQCLVSYENINNNKSGDSSIGIQNFILPQFENDIIIDFRLIYFNLDENKMYKIYKNKMIIFLNNNKIYYYLINDSNSKDINNNNNINQIKEIENIIVDCFKVKYDYLFVFYNNSYINVYKIELNDNNNNKDSIIKNIKKIEYNKNNDIFLKRKIFFDKNDSTIFVYFMDYLFEQYFFCFQINDKSSEINNIKEIKLNKENKFYTPNNFYKKKLYNTYIYYINKKHSVIFNTSFYNKLVINFKIYKTLILILNNESKIEIYNFDYKNKKIKNLVYIIYLEFNFYTVIDYLMINPNYVLLLNINPETSLLELNKINLILTENNNIKDNNNSTGIKLCLFESKTAYNNLYYIKQLNLLLINSNYGEISIYNIDSNSNIEFNTGFNYGFSSSEIIKIKNSLNENDFSKLFLYDLIHKKLKNFNLINIHHVLNYKENDLFFFHLIILLYKEIFITLVVMENKFTLMKKVLFGKQIKYDRNNFVDVSDPFKLILDNLSYDINTHTFDFSEPIKPVII